jgi:glycerophosphoryl diester phosphodiesterase
VTEIIAHRGASRAEPENTLAAFRRAATLGAGWVELDVRPSRDRQLVVHHDPRYGDGRVIAEIDAAARPDAVPLLDDALDACAGAGLRVNVEIKNEPGEPGYEPTGWLVAAVVDLISRRGEIDRVVVSCFDRATLDQVLAGEPALPTAWLTQNVPGPGAQRNAMLDSLAGAGHRGLHPWWGLADPELVAACHARQLFVNVWTCDDQTAMARLVVAGVDGICTNVPDVAAAVLAGEVQRISSTAHRRDRAQPPPGER